jgi:hypothetical protein
MNMIELTKNNAIDSTTINDVEYRKIKILRQINDIICFGTFKEDIDLLIDDCSNLNKTLVNQYFYDLISNLQSNDTYLNDDIYILEELVKIRKFLNVN